MSLRQWLWTLIYSGGEGSLPPVMLDPVEVMGTAVAAGLILWLCWSVMRTVFFAMAENAHASRLAAVTCGIGLSVAWSLGSLEWAGMHSRLWMLVLVIGSVAGALSYLMWMKYA